MPHLENLPIELDVDTVLRAQGADPESVRARRPDLVEDTRQALEAGLPLLAPRALYATHRVTDVRHNRLTLEGGGRLTGAFLLEHLAPASEVIVILCTVGEAIERQVSAVFAEDPVLALALDAVGSAAVESLSVSATRYFEELARERGHGVSVPLSPGMEDWPTAEGQPQLFGLLRADEIGVSLTPHSLMRPAKSLSLVLGTGPHVATKGTICDYCAVRATCRHRGSHH